MVGHKQFNSQFGTTELMCSVLQWLQIPQGRKTCTGITSHSQYCLYVQLHLFSFQIVNLTLTQTWLSFATISSVGAFIAVYVHKCKYFSWNNQKSMELMQYYNPGFPVPLKQILKNCVLETYLFMVAPVYLIHTSCCVKPC